MNPTYCRQAGGQIREILCVARHSEEDLEWMVIQRDFFNPGGTCAIATPLDIFQAHYICVEYDFASKKWVKSDRAFSFPEESALIDFHSSKSSTTELRGEEIA